MGKQTNSGASCSGHSKEFCRGWDAGVGRGGSSSNNNNPTIGSISISAKEVADGGSNTGTDWIGLVYVQHFNQHFIHHVIHL